MPFRLSRSDADLTATLRRLAAEELGATLAHPDRADTPGMIHDSRKRVKKLRAALRLMRAGFPGGAAENAVLRDAARGIGALRDAEVLLATHDRLFPDGGETPLRARLQARLAAARTDPAQAARLAAFRAAMAGVLARSAEWQVTGKDARILAEGLTRARARARLAMDRARRSGDDAAMHDWRKRIKDIWYQSRLFAPVWPEVLAPLTQAADDLGEALGHHHDLAVFRATLGQIARALPGPLPAALCLTADTRAAEAQTALADDAFALGARLLAGDPGAVAAQWVEWWQLWRG